MAEDQKEKALLDTEELTGFDDEEQPSDSDKVELDLDDAPFLDDDDEEEEEAPEEETKEAAPTDEPAEEKPPSRLAILLEQAKAFLKTKQGKIGAIAAGVLFVLLLVILLLPSSAPPPPPSPAEVEEPPLVEVEPDEPVPFEFVTSLEPFMVEYEQPDGTYRFLSTRLSLATENERLSFEIRSKMIDIRDAIFYYLRNKDMTFLANRDNVEILKRDLLAVVNQYLATDQLEVILIEEYLIK